MSTVTVKSLQNLSQLVVTPGHAFVADEPADVGDDLGPNPYELLLAALGTCTAMTLLLYTRHKNWPLESIEVECRHERVHAADVGEMGDETGGKIDLITREIRLHGDLTEQQRARIEVIATKCPVTKTLLSQPRIVDEVVVAS
jgi:putative redox protein